MPDTLKLLILGAHPDDCDIHAGGLAALYRQFGHTVKMISLTNGDAGHQTLRGEELAQVRRREAKAAGQTIGAEYLTWDHHDGQLLPTLELREQVIREIRTFQPDMVVTHRDNDYHPDHRAVGNVVRDASYMVTVPAVVPDVPILARDPVVAYMCDRFTRPNPFRADVIVDITEQVDQVVSMLDCHRSQFYEWLPFNRGELDQVPQGDKARWEWLKDWYVRRQRNVAETHREKLVETYGREHGEKVVMAEAFEVSEYASQLSPENQRRLFPFLP